MKEATIMNYSLENAKNHQHDYTGANDRRRTIRIHRSGLKRSELEQLDRPSLKFAETKDELEQTFRLVYDVYRKKGLVPQDNEIQMLYNIYSLLPDTTHVIAKSYRDVISNLTEIFDHEYFGLPMDDLYNYELNYLRNKGRKVVELSSLATPREHRWKNIFHYLVQVVYWYALYAEVDDICISINPRHVRYYKSLFPFEEFGPKRHYERVGAPAIGLRVRVKEITEQMKEICDKLNFNNPLYEYFYKMTGYEPHQELPYMEKGDLQIVIHPNRLDAQTVGYFIRLNPQILSDFNQDQIDKLCSIYPGLQVPD